MTRSYASGREAITDIGGGKRPVPVLSINGKDISAFHLGAGEFTMTELLQKLQTHVPRNSLILIDEVETSLHPRAQRKLMRDLADRSRVNEWQIILTTHSPYVLGELPPVARGYIMTTGGQKQVVFGVSPDYAMTKMDDEIHHECDVYVEDNRAKIMVQEALVAYAPEFLDRIRITAFGTASVGQALGQMASTGRFNRPSVVFLDGDQADSVGCSILPGEDAPERVVFDSLRAKQWTLLDAKICRDFAELSDACNRAMTESDHHGWVHSVAKSMHIGSDTLWESMCGQWASNCLSKDDAEAICDPIRAALT